MPQILLDNKQKSRFGCFAKQPSHLIAPSVTTGQLPQPVQHRKTGHQDDDKHVRKFLGKIGSSVKTKPQRVILFPRNWGKCVHCCAGNRIMCKRPTDWSCCLFGDIKLVCPRGRGAIRCNGIQHCQTFMSSQRDSPCSLPLCRIRVHSALLAWVKGFLGTPILFEMKRPQGKIFISQTSRQHLQTENFPLKITDLPCCELVMDSNNLLNSSADFTPMFANAREKRHSCCSNNCTHASKRTKYFTIGLKRSKQEFKTTRILLSTPTHTFAPLSIQQTLFPFSSNQFLSVCAWHLEGLLFFVGRKRKV